MFRNMSDTAFSVFLSIFPPFDITFKCSTPFLLLSLPRLLNDAAHDWLQKLPFGFCSLFWTVIVFEQFLQDLMTDVMLFLAAHSRLQNLNRDWFATVRINFAALSKVFAQYSHSKGTRSLDRRVASVDGGIKTFITNLLYTLFQIPPTEPSFMVYFVYCGKTATFHPSSLD